METDSGSAPATALLTLAAMVAFAANSVLARLGLGAGAIDPASYTGVRLMAGAAVLWLIVRISRRPDRQRPAGSWMAAAMLFLYAVCFSFAYIDLSTGTGALILFAAVQLTMIAAGLWMGERPGPLEWIGLIVAIAGLAYLVSPGISAPSASGSVLMAIAGIGWGVYSIRGRGAADPLGATAGNFLRSVPLAAVPFLFTYPQANVSRAGLSYALVSGALSSGLGYAIWYAALRGLTATRAATVQLSVPVIAALGGVVFLFEPITFRLVVASAAILAGIAVAVASKNRPFHRRNSD